MSLHTCGSTLTVGHIWRHFARAPVWITLCTNAHLYWPATAPRRGTFLPLRPRETDLPAQRTQAEAQARVSCAHGYACGPRDSEAPSREGPEASLRVKQAPLCNAGTACLARETSMLCTARGARPRQGSWSSTGSSARRIPASPRLGLAVPRAAGNAVARNRIKRQLREVWTKRLEGVPVGRDYVLIAKPGLPEAVTANGFDWLAERVDEVLTKAAA